MEETLAEALRARIDGRKQKYVAQSMGLSQNRLSEILKGEPVYVGKAALGILSRYPELWPFFFPPDIVQAICKEVERNGLTQGTA